MKAKRKHVYREGDKVRIVNSRFIRRVGYDLHPDDLKEEIAESEKFKAALKALGYEHINHNRAYRKLIDAIAFAEVHVRGFGGKQRRIHYYETIPDTGGWWSDKHDTRQDRSGYVVQIDGKRTVQTGDYFPPWSDQSYEGEWDYDPGGLSNPKTHILLKTAYGEIEACDVEPVDE